jgi:hypothetical protein
MQTDVEKRNKTEFLQQNSLKGNQTQKRLVGYLRKLFQIHRLYKVELVGKMVMNGEQARILKEVVAVSQYCRGTEKIHDNVRKFYSKPDKDLTEVPSEYKLLLLFLLMSMG